MKAPIRQTSSSAPALSAVPVALIALVAAGCSNNMGTATTSGSTSTTTAASTTSSVGSSAAQGAAPSTIGSSSGNFVITSLNVSQTSATSGSTPGAGVVNIFFNASQASSNPFTNYCAPPSSGGTNGCNCVFSWVEVSGGQNISRQVLSGLSAAQLAAASCPTPSVWYTEIPNGTPVRISVAPASGNTMSFGVTGFNYTVGGDSTSTGGAQFSNILRYSCYEQISKGLEVQSRTQVFTDSAGNTRTTPLANLFCFQKASGGNLAQSSSTGCDNLPTSLGRSAQSNYYNLYIPTGNSPNPGNDRFVCPVVREALNRGVSLAQGGYWPLDSSFRLSNTSTTSFTVGVPGRSKTSNPNDPTSVNTACGSTTSTPAPLNSFVNSCLGYAATPNGDGTCPTLTDSSGNPLPTYRLRRYVTVYPRIYNSDGTTMGDAQGADIAYVVDRPVSASPAGLNYTMYGPKPCPAAYFDKSGLVNGTGIGQYYATSNAGWTGKDVDGVRFPDTDSGTAASCSAAIPIFNANWTVATVATVNPVNPQPTFQHRFIRPLSPWAPHYEEDISFQACAPLASPLTDPPLHFARSATGNVSWCAETAPTQNDNVTALDPALTGQVQPFTSHVASNSTSTACTATPLLNVGGERAGVWQHGGALAATCDRTILDLSGVPTLTALPLQAPSADIEAAITADKSYNCLVSHDNGIKTNLASPSQGCCGTATSVWTVQQAGRTATTAHLEPPITLGPTACGSTQW